MEGKKKHISETKLIFLHNSIGFLHNYTNDKNEIHFVIDESEKINLVKTDALNKLNKLNQEKKELIEILSK